MPVLFDFTLDINRYGISANADSKLEAGREPVAGDINSGVEVFDNRGKCNRIHIEHAGGAWVLAEFGRVTGYNQEIAQAEHVRAEDVRLNSDEVSVAAAKVHDSFYARFLFDFNSGCNRAESGAGPRAVRQIYSVYAHPLT